MNDVNPLTEADKQAIDTSLAELDGAEKLLIRARNGGLDVTDKLKDIKTSKDKLLKLKQSFFPQG